MNGLLICTNKMRWANFLHFYQPPTQKPFWVHKVTAEAYRPILEGFSRNKECKLTLNINGVLLELLDQYGEHDVLDLLRNLVSEGRIELTGSAKFHPLLPFMPEDEIIRQIRLNEETIRKYIGDSWQKRGFFPPEMGFDSRVGNIVRKLGYNWVIVDELSFPRDRRPMEHNTLYTMEDDFFIYFRERQMSWFILSGQVGTGNLLVQSLGNRLSTDEYLLTAMDGETFGHHRPGLQELLFEVYGQRGIEPVLISDLPQFYSKRGKIEPVPSTWALMEKDLEERKPFSRWKDSDNIIQTKQWELTEFAIDAMRKADPKALGYDKARGILDRALHSDQYWWASARPWWSIEMVERGAKDLFMAVAAIPDVDEDTRKLAHRLYEQIIFTAFDWQREGIVDSLSKREDEDIRQRTDHNMPSLPKEELEKMIAKLQEEMESVAVKKEYERAAQIRDRIAELRRYQHGASLQHMIKEGDKEWEG